MDLSLFLNILSRKNIKKIFAIGLIIKKLQVRIVLKWLTHSLTHYAFKMLRNPISNLWTVTRFFNKIPQEFYKKQKNEFLSNSNNFLNIIFLRYWMEVENHIKKLFLRFDRSNVKTAIFLVSRILHNFW